MTRIRSVTLLAAAFALPNSKVVTTDEGHEGVVSELDAGPRLKSSSQHREALGVVEADQHCVSEASLATSAKLGVGVNDHLCPSGEIRTGWHSYDSGCDLTPLGKPGQLSGAIETDIKALALLHTVDAIVH